MPTRANNIQYAMYAIAEVESNWTWNSTYTADAITIGIMQCWAYNAARLLRKHKDQNAEGWAAFATAAPRIVENMTNWSDDSSKWTTVYITQAEVNALRKLLKTADSHRIQTEDWTEECNGYMKTLVNKHGMSDERARALIFACGMYHQSPQGCLQVLDSVGGRASLKTLKNAALNNGILGRYRNRYNTLYNRLASWDMESAPPDFGQVIDKDATSSQPSYSQTANRYSGQVSRISYSQGRMIIYGKGYEDGIQCYRTSGGVWIPSQSVGTTASGNASSGADWDGGGTSSGTASGDAKKVCDLYDSWVGRAFKYSQDGGLRLSLPESGASDCSGSIWCAYNLAIGKNVGTWTDPMNTKGKLIDSGKVSSFGISQIAKMQPADLIIFNYDGSSSSGTDHVEMFMGSGYRQNLLGGGSAPVPHYKDCLSYMQNRAAAHPNAHYWIRRYI